MRTDATFLLEEQGRLQSSGRIMDLAIDGVGVVGLMGPAGQTLL